MKPRLSLLLAALALPALAHASSFQTHQSLFNSFNFFGGINAGNLAAATNFDAPVGIGTLQYDGPRLEDGYYDFASISNLSSFQIEISFLVGEGSHTFNDSHITTDTGDLQIYLANDAFHFVGPGLTSDGGSINFVNGETGLSFSPQGFTAYAYVLFAISESNESPLANGLYGTAETTYFGAAIPEPSSAAALAGFAILGLAATRRRRAA